MASIFTRIVRGELPADRVAEDARHLALLDIQPVQPGHTLVVPKDEVAYLFDMTPEAQAALWAFVARVEAAVREATGCQRVVVMVVGWEVPHVHVHLIPTNRLGDVPFPPKITSTASAREEMARRIAAALPS